ncbi:MAG: hypothetical protein MPW14_01180 [Candidatus Manganitrophus sp.]|nr:MAG: hypothetical protein MPW14_01180 [Candidatus Manganitrophus sp.]
MLQKYLIAKDWLHRLIERSFQWRLAVLAQGLWSAASFLVTMYLVRSLAVHDFGMFAVGVSTRYFFLMILSALAISPMLVISSRRVVNNQKIPFWPQLFLVLRSFFFISVLISIFVGRLNGWPAVEFIIFIFGGLAVELQRRINFIHQRISQDFVGGLVSIAGTIGSLFLLQKYGFFTLANIFLVLGLVNFLWACQSGWGYWLRPSVPSEIADLNEVWKIGRWGLGTNLAGYAYTQVSTFLTLGLIGTAGVAVLGIGTSIYIADPSSSGGGRQFMADKTCKKCRQEFAGLFCSRGLAGELDTNPCRRGASVGDSVLSSLPYSVDCSGERSRPTRRLYPLPGFYPAP